jgi:putative FmdB family regulatory protein
MPIYEISCRACGFAGEVIAPATPDRAACPSCGGSDTEKRISATSTLTGQGRQSRPGPGDSGCCGEKPGAAAAGGCAGPGSCCGRN